MTVPTQAQPTVTAAGVVCWREQHGKIRVLLVRRDSRSDISLPKGKTEPDESLQQAAVRETLEETGFRVVLGAPLGVSSYPLPGGRDKVVHYWTAEVDERMLAARSFTPTAEISGTEWVSIDTARSKLTYERDREVLDRFAERARAKHLRTFAIIALRHARAVPAGNWSGSDSSRPLQPIGLDQARTAARAIATYRPRKLISSSAARCVSTIEAVATVTGLDIKATSGISQDAHEEGTARVGKIVKKRMEKGLTTVLCSHGPVLPDILDEVARLSGSTGEYTVHRAGMLAIGAFSVVHIASDDRSFVAVETHASPVG
ncbi:NUDIX hydrolase [Marisediminicola senii]|uniref:NUDIX hydrolase n=1 Tax=Marisediminicola senii TaxID=2711233 RepID=UPI0013EE2340|nr:NUDIX hydrolase [Marisediminicola senii]